MVTITFGGIAEGILLIASSRKDIVFDVYKDNSIKTTEREDRGVKLPSSNFFAKLGEMVHTQRSLVTNYSSLHVGNSVSKSLKMALRLLMNLLPPKKKLTHA